MGQIGKLLTQIILRMLKNTMKSILNHIRMRCLIMISLKGGVIFFSSFFLYLSSSCYLHGETLCKAQEKNVFSFGVVGSEKIASVCEGGGNSYLIYRFGKPCNIEMVFPARLSNESWRYFAFKGYQRPGGITNDGMGDYTLSFSKSGVTYTIYQQWRDSDKSYDIGILVETSKRDVSIHGSKETQVGSLVLLEGVTMLPN